MSKRVLVGNNVLRSSVSGGGGVVEFDTITALYDARDVSSLSAGDVCRIAWTGDLYAPDGAILTEYDGVDFIQNPLTQVEMPSWLFETADWDPTDSTAGTISADGDGRPVITIPQANSGTAYYQLASRYGGAYVGVAAEWELLNAHTFNAYGGSVSGTQLVGVGVGDRNGIRDDFAIAYVADRGAWSGGVWNFGNSSIELWNSITSPNQNAGDAVEEIRTFLSLQSNGAASDTYEVAALIRKIDGIESSIITSGTPHQDVGAYNAQWGDQFPLIVVDHKALTNASGNDTVFTLRTLSVRERPLPNQDPTTF